MSTKKPQQLRIRPVPAAAPAPAPLLTENAAPLPPVEAVAQAAPAAPLANTTPPPAEGDFPHKPGPVVPPGKERLAAVAQWAAEPSNPPAEVVVPAPVPEPPKAPQNPLEALLSKARTDGIKQLNVDVPEGLKCALEYIGQTTYKVSMRQYIIQALYSAVLDTFKERGEEGAVELLKKLRGDHA